MKRIWRSSLPPPSSFLEPDDCLPAAVDTMTGSRRSGKVATFMAAARPMQCSVYPCPISSRGECRSFWEAAASSLQVGAHGDRNQKNPNDFWSEWQDSNLRPPRLSAPADIASFAFAASPDQRP